MAESSKADKTETLTDAQETVVIDGVRRPYPVCYFTTSDEWDAQWHDQNKHPRFSQAPWWDHRKAHPKHKLK